jgi:mRNA interferase YafQ
MKRKIVPSTKFKKDLKKALKSKTFDINVFKDVVEKLEYDVPLDTKYKDHPLHGDYEGFRDCHIHPDWVLIYGKTDTNELRILELVRLNSHSNLFK